MAGKRPQPIGNILADLLARRGYARVQASQSWTEAWQAAAGDFLARHTRVGSVQRGVLLVQVANSTVAQELSFQKTAILERLRELAPDERLDDLRCRVGPLD